jgi:membrane protein
MDAKTETTQAESLVARVRALIERVRAWAEQTIWWKMWERMLENEFIDRAVALGAKAFVSLFPAILVITAFAPHNVQRGIQTTLANRAGLSGDSLASVRAAFASSGDVKRATGILGLILTFFYINSFTTALSRVYTRAWRRPKVPQVTGYVFGASWFIGLCAYFALLGGARRFLNNGYTTPAFAVVALAAIVGLWWVTAWLMLRRQVRWRPLLVTALLTGIGMAVYGVTASLWMPNTMSSNQHQFGLFGVSLALVSWLTGACTVIVTAACIGPVVAEDEGIFGRLARGPGRTDVLVPGAPPSEPAPLRGARLRNALGLGVDEDDN